MASVNLLGKTFDYVVEGTGQPVVHILGLEPRTEHQRSTDIPKISEYLKNGFRVISYNTYRMSGGPLYVTDARSVAEVEAVANDCFVFLQHLNVSGAHIFAHNQVGLPAIKLALEHPDLVKSLSFSNFQILPPFFMKPKVQAAMGRAIQKTANNPQFQQRMEMMRQMMEAAKSRKTEDGEPVDPKIAAQFDRISPLLSEYFTPGADQTDSLSLQLRMIITQALTIPYEQVPSMVKQPVFAAIFSDTGDWARQSADLLKNWLTQTEIFTVPKKSHWYSGQNDQGLAAGLADFYGRHPLFY